MKCIDCNTQIESRKMVFCQSCEMEYCPNCINGNSRCVSCQKQDDEFAPSNNFDYRIHPLPENGLDIFGEVYPHHLYQIW